MATIGRVNCRYCGKVCTTREELERTSWVGNGKARVIVCVCNACGGYENCPSCGRLWDACENPGGGPCWECSERADAMTKNNRAPQEVVREQEGLA